MNYKPKWHIIEVWPIIEPTCALMHYIQDWMIKSSNTNRQSAVPTDPNSLGGNQLTLARTLKAAFYRCTSKKYLKACNFIKKWHRCFPVRFTNLLRTPFFIEYLRWLLLEFKWKSSGWYRAGESFPSMVIQYWFWGSQFNYRKITKKTVNVTMKSLFYHYPVFSNIELFFD